MADDLLTNLDRLGKTIQNVFLINEQDIDVKEASKNINNQDPIVALRAALVCTNSHDEYSVGFRNGIRYSISVLTGKEPKYEDVT